MFDALSEKISGIFRTMGGNIRLTESNIQEGLREIRLALLEADVSLPVVKDFIARVTEKALGQEVLRDVTPGQFLVKVVHDELVDLLGGETQELNLSGPTPQIIMLVGLQGSGKTTSIAKLAHLLRERKMRPYLVPADVYRPAAIDQLTTLAGQLDMPVYPSTTAMNPVDIAKNAVDAARAAQSTVILLDTAGRLHVDEPLMAELKAIKDAVAPAEILFVADAMTGQDAVTAAKAFNEALHISGVILTKMDGDARGGAALSIKSVSGAPVKFVGMGEKIDALEVFHPERIAGRILGMGDVLTLIEKTEAVIEEKEAEELARKMRKAEFNLEDFRTQMRRLRSMGSLESLLKLIPGMGALRNKLGDMAVPEKDLNRTEAIINSMTKQERGDPKIISSSRRQRIAKGSGTTVQDVNQLLRQFEQMRDMMKRMAGGLGGGAAAGQPRLGTALGGGFGGMPGMGMPGMPGMPGLGPAAGGFGGGASKIDKKKKQKERKRERQNKKRR